VIGPVVYCRLLFSAIIAFAAVTAFSPSATAEGGDIQIGAPETLLAQASGYDPMRPLTASPGASPRPEGNPEFDGLIDAPGAEDTFYMCSACHSIALVKQQRLTDARWDYLWQWMIDEQGMADGGEELRGTILGYLKEHYSSEK
jgi:hypothetical protein